jgi:hypothetical protein
MALGDSLKKHIDLAKNSVSQAGDKLNDMKDQGVDALKRNVDEAGDALTALKDGSVEKAREITSQLTDKILHLKQAGIDLVKSSLEELSIAQPTVEKAGFKVHDINIGIGIPPQIGISFSIQQPVDLQSLRTFQDENQDKQLVLALVSALIQAYELSENIKMKKFSLTGVGIKLGIPPDVSLRYS